MKRARILFTLAALGLLAGSSSAFAAAMNGNDDCVVVPAVQWKTAQQFTAVGLIAMNPGRIHWAFFDATGLKRAGGSVNQARANEAVNFLWNSAQTGASNLANTLGYLLFCEDNNSDDQILNEMGGLSASAFSIDLAANDVGMIPTIEVNENNLNPNLPGQWNNDPVTGFNGGASGTNPAPAPQDIVTVKYLVDFKPTTAADNQRDTKIYMYASSAPGANQPGMVFNAAGDNRPVTFQATNLMTELDPESFNFTGSSSGFEDGYLQWAVPATVNQVFVFAIIDARDFGAVQTVLGNIFP